MRKITLYVMREIKDEALGNKHMLGIRGLGEGIINLAKYYAYVDEQLEEEEYPLLEDLYQGRVFVSNSKVYKLQVNYTDADLYTLNLLSVLWDCPSISKIANFLLYKLSYIPLGDYYNKVSATNIKIPNYSSWTKLEVLVKDSEIMAQYFHLLGNRLQQHPLLSATGLPKGAHESLQKVAQDDLLLDIIREGLKNIKN
ncbi:MAG: hypothetical protein M0Q88_08625 [Bacilli bacterium]|nr:hypothetical protein [Bacilli bacterium]